MKFRIFLGAITILFSSLVFALNLGEAKDNGLAGEQQDGYLGVIVQQPDVAKLVNEINALRKAKYIELAAKNGITLEQVEQLAAKKAFQKTESGHYLKNNGEWVKK